MKILVTGGAGYIGSHVVNLLGKANHDIVTVDNLSTGKKEAVLYGQFIHADLSDIQSIENVLAEGKFEACLHFAGSIIVPESVQKPLDYYQNNTLNSQHLIGLCNRHGVNKFIFSSTAAVYGIPDNGRCTEETPTRPINPYGRSKLVTEWILEDVSHSSELKYVCLRYFNVAGANVDGLLGQRGSNSTHLLKVASEAATGKKNKMNIFGTDYPTSDGTCIRDYIHVDDLAQAHLDVLTYLSEGGSSSVFNCGYGHGHSVKEIVSMVKKISGSNFTVEETGRRDGDSPILVSIPQKILSSTNWTPKYDNLELIVKSAYEWEKKI